jgi:ferredoxin
MILPKDRLNDWLTTLQTGTLYGPIESNGVILHKRIADPGDMIVDGRSVNSPKTVILPQTETLFTYTRGHEKILSDRSGGDGTNVIFGLRPCDAKALSTLDHVFNDEFKDSHFTEALDRSILIGLACSEPGSNCFCTSFEYGPGSGEDMDILLTDLGDRYFVDAITDRGRSLAGGGNGLFSPATEEDRELKDDTISRSESRITRKVKVDGLPSILEGSFESDLWKAIAMKCLGCGICTYLCPTCHCFDIQDEVHLGTGRRARMWDSCMYPEYTLHTSGHNPRPARMNRLRNRVLHKFKYYHDNFGNFLCVGCGRCVDMCPVNVDIIDIIDRVREEVE